MVNLTLHCAFRSQAPEGHLENTPLGCSTLFCRARNISEGWYENSTHPFYITLYCSVPGAGPGESRGLKSNPSTSCISGLTWYRSEQVVKQRMQKTKGFILFG